VDSLKALDPKWPIREVDVGQRLPVGVADDEAGVICLHDGPGRREAALFPIAAGGVAGR
jgi:hypothetical protein